MNIRRQDIAAFYPEASKLLEEGRIKESRLALLKAIEKDACLTLTRIPTNDGDFVLVKPAPTIVEVNPARPARSGKDHRAYRKPAGLRAR